MAKLSDKKKRWIKNEVKDFSFLLPSLDYIHHYYNNPVDIRNPLYLYRLERNVKGY